jgi:hypothetical protein
MVFAMILKTRGIYMGFEHWANTRFAPTDWYRIWPDTLFRRKIHYRT